MKIHLANTLTQMQTFGALKLAQRSQHGIEREALRITSTGQLSQRPHPQVLGSKLTHPYITTDYSEALLELITPAYQSLDELMTFLDEVHRFTYQHLPADEMLWCTSMPCPFDSAQDIPIADYGSSAIGRMKHLYRKGLAHRYGKSMQIIAGAHYNCSFPDEFWQCLQHLRGDSSSFVEFKNQASMGLIRNFLRLGWLVITLFGASPAMCRSFHSEAPMSLQVRSNHSLLGPYATSLRMSDIGYNNHSQAHLHISYNNLADYISDLQRATMEQDPHYLNFVAEDGRPQQLSPNVLQIEAEFYAAIRPKHSTLSGERHIRALKERGIEYFEIRSLDIDPFQPLGISREQLAFLHCLLLYCALTESPPLSPTEEQHIKANQAQVVLRGRQTHCDLIGSTGQPVLLQDWAERCFVDLQEVAAYLDSETNATTYQQAVARFRELCQKPEQLVSGRVYRSLIDDFDGHFFAFALELSQQHRTHCCHTPLCPEVVQRWRTRSQDSLTEQADLEAQPQPTLEQAFARYMAMD